MKKLPTSKQLINAELAVKAQNTRAKNMLKKHTPKQLQPGLVVEFNCECSNMACVQRISLTLEQYEQLHKNNSRFVLAQGHEEPRVEKVVKEKQEFSIVIVEKYAL